VEGKQSGLPGIRTGRANPMQAAENARAAHGELPVFAATLNVRIIAVLAAGRWLDALAAPDRRYSPDRSLRAGGVTGRMLCDPAKFHNGACDGRRAKNTVVMILPSPCGQSRFLGARAACSVLFMARSYPRALVLGWRAVVAVLASQCAVHSRRHVQMALFQTRPTVGR